MHFNWRFLLIPALGFCLMGAGMVAPRPLNCTALLEGGQRTPAIVDLNEPSLALDAVRTRMTEAIAWANETLFGRFFLPAEIGVGLAGSNESPYMHSIDWTIFSHPDMDPSGAVEAHEYAHAVFAVNMDQYSKIWAAFRRAVETYQRLWRHELHALDAELAEADKPGSSSKQRSEIAERRKAWLERHEPGQPEIVGLSAPYQELFSDLAGALRAGSFQAYGDLLAKFAEPILRSKFLLEDVIQLRLKQTHARNFADKVFVEGWNERIRELDSPEEKPVHVLLNPTRHFIYVNYLQRHMTPAYRQGLIRCLFGVLALQVIEDDVAYVPGSEGPTPEQMNLNLIAKLKEYCPGR